MLKKLILVSMALYLTGCTVYGYSFKNRNETLSSFEMRSPKKVLVSVSGINSNPFSIYYWGDKRQPIAPTNNEIKTVLSLIPYVEQTKISSEADYVIELNFSGRSIPNQRPSFLCMLTVTLIPCGIDALSIVSISVKDSNGSPVFYKRYTLELTAYKSLFYFPSFIVGKSRSRIAKDFLYESLSDVLMRMHGKGYL